MAHFHRLFPVLLGLLTLPVAAAELELISRVSYPAGATQPGKTETSGRRSLSTDGRFAVFATTTTAVVPGLIDLNGYSDVYLHDRTTGTFKLVSHVAGQNKRAGNGASTQPMISADGRYVLFTSTATDLVAPMTWNQQVFRYDRVSGQTQLVSHHRTLGTLPLGGYNYGLDISDSGQYVALYSSAHASELVAGAVDENLPNGGGDLFLWDAIADSFRLITHTPEDPLTTTTVLATSIEARMVEVADNGRIAFRGRRFLAPGGNLTHFDIFVFDPTTGNNHLASHNSSSLTVPASASVSTFCDFTPDGRYVLFTHPGTDLIAGLTDTNSADDLFLYDHRNGNLELISNDRLSSTTAGNGTSGCGKISNDARYVSLVSAASNLATGNHPNSIGYDLFQKDRQTGTAQLLSGSAANPLDATGLNLPRLETATNDGQAVLFDSSATNLVTGATPSGSAPWSFRWEAGMGNELGVPAAGNATTSYTTEARSLSGDGSRAIFETTRPTEMTGAPNIAVDALTQPILFTTGNAAGTLALPAAFAGSGSPTQSPYPYPNLNAEFSAALVAEDGSKVAFVSNSNEICGSGRPLCLLDRRTNTFTNVKHLPLNPNSFFTEETFPLEISQDGRWLLLKTMSPALTTTDTNNSWDVYLYDTTNKTFELLSHAAGAPTTAGNQSSRQLRNGHRGLLTPAGDRVVFESRATNLVAGATVSSANVYFLNRQAGGLRLLSHRFDNAALGANSGAFSPVIAADGNYVAFFSNATNLISGYELAPDFVGLYDLYLYDLASGTAQLVSHTGTNPLEGHRGTPQTIQISTDGRFLLHANFTPSLIDGGSDTNENHDLFLFDRTTGNNTLITHAHGQPLVASDGTANSGLNMSSDGRFVVFRSNATNILPGVSGDQIYLWDRLDGSRRLVSHRRGNPNLPLSGLLGMVSFSPDGNQVIFSTVDPTVIPGLSDTNDDFDLFVWHRATNYIELLTPLWGSSGEAAGGGCQLDHGARPPSAHGEFLLLWCRGASLARFDNNSPNGPMGLDLFLLQQPTVLFADGFESANTAAWSLTMP